MELNIDANDVINELRVKLADLEYQMVLKDLYIKKLESMIPLPEEKSQQFEMVPE